MLVLKIPNFSERLNHRITNIFRKETIALRIAHKSYIHTYIHTYVRKYVRLSVRPSIYPSELLPEMQGIKSRCKEHFYLLLNQQGTALSTAGDDICGAISMTEIMRAFLATASRKSPGLDGIPSHILKKGGSQLRESPCCCTTDVKYCKIFVMP